MAQHPHNRLTDLAIKRKTSPGRYADGNGLYLVVDESGAKRWVLRTVVQGRRRDMGLGSLRLVSLAEARKKAKQYREQARAGEDPFAIRRKSAVAIPTFEEAARRVHSDFKVSWKNQKHSNDWIGSLTQYVFPKFGSTPVHLVESSDVLQALAPIWITKPETARRVKQRIATVLDWAKAHNYRSGESPVQGIGNGKGLPKQRDESDSHHAALAYAKVPEFVSRLRATEASEPIKLAFELLILTAARTAEVRFATPGEFDLDAKIWTIPAQRMKTNKEHRVPLSNRCVEILQRAQQCVTGPYAFSVGTKGKPLSNTVFLMILRRMNVSVTTHGFRSTFRDWAAEQTNYPREVCEAALAHSTKSKTEAAYNRTDLFEKRRGLMDTWSAYATKSGTVVQLRA